MESQQLWGFMEFVAMSQTFQDLERLLTQDRKAGKGCGLRDPLWKGVAHSCTMLYMFIIIILWIYIFILWCVYTISMLILDISPPEPPQKKTDLQNGLSFGTVPALRFPSEDLVQELRDLPRNVCVRRVNEVVARARAVKVHLALGILAAQKTSLFFFLGCR